VCSLVCAAGQGNHHWGSLTFVGLLASLRLVCLELLEHVLTCPLLMCCISCDKEYSGRNCGLSADVASSRAHLSESLLSQLATVTTSLVRGCFLLLAVLVDFASRE
jgi:hypothetical protein